MFFCGCRTVVRCLWSRQFEYNETAEKPPTGRFFWKVNIVCFFRVLFSYKSTLFCNSDSELQNSPAKAPDDKVFARCDERPKALPLGTASFL